MREAVGMIIKARRRRRRCAGVCTVEPCGRVKKCFFVRAVRVRRHGRVSCGMSHGCAPPPGQYNCSNHYAAWNLPSRGRSPLLSSAVSPQSLGPPPPFSEIHRRTEYQPACSAPRQRYLAGCGGSSGARGGEVRPSGEVSHGGRVHC